MNTDIQAPKQIQTRLAKQASHKADLCYRRIAGRQIYVTAGLLVVDDPGFSDDLILLQEQAP
jgi:hypothetical protein